MKKRGLLSWVLEFAGRRNHTLGGRNVKEYSFDSLMENFSFVFQRVYLFEDTIANNIRFARPDASMDEVMDAARKASCHDFIMSLPNGYETVIGEGGATLSGGQKQRVAIASAIAAKAKLLLFDEPTSGLDYLHMEKVGELLKDLSLQGNTVLVSTHDSELIETCCDYTLLIEKGRVGSLKKV